MDRLFGLPRLVAALVCLVLSGSLSGCGSAVVAGTHATLGVPVVSAPVSPAPPVVSVPPPVIPVAGKWVGAWGAAMTNADASAENAGGAEESFRFLLLPTVGGTQERVRFSNVYGKTPVVLGAARLAVAREGIGKGEAATVDAARDQALLFAGKASVVVGPGQVVVSDPVMVPFAFGETLAVSVYLRGQFGPVSRHSSIFVTNYRSGTGSGDVTADATGAGFSKGTLQDWLLVNGVDVFGDYQGTVVLFGSSTTDGFHSNYSSDKVYPVPNAPVDGQHSSRLSDSLARRLNAAGYRLGVVNEGVPGDTVTVDSTNLTNDVQNANDRIAQDVLAQPSVVAMVTYFGSIDIRSPDCKSAPAIEAATEKLIATATAAGVRVVLGTIPPSAFCTNPAQNNYGPVPSPADPYAGGSVPGPANGGEVQRTALNAWLRETGAGLPGVVAIADFDGALADPMRPNFLLPPYNSGDNYHPTGAGYGAEAGVIPLELLLPPVAK